MRFSNASTPRTVVVMEGPRTSELRLAGSKTQALAAIREALPGDAVVRGEDDAVGRFASERTVMIIGRGERRLMLFQGGWRLVKAREGKPQLEVEFVEGAPGVRVRLTRGAVDKVSLRSRVLDVAGNVATVAILVVAYHLFQDIPIDNVVVATIGAGGGLAWSAVAHFWPKPEDAGLEGMVRGALQSMVAEEDGGDGS